MSEDTKTWPHHELGKELSNWGRWGDDDEIGTLNFVTPEKRIQAGQLIKTGKIFDMGMAFDSDGPQDGSFRINPVHVMTFSPVDTAGAPDGMIAADDMITMGLQCATQWDSLAHVGYDGFFYNGVPAQAVGTWHGAAKNSIAKSMDRLITRGVLLDIAGLKGVEILPDSYEVTSAELTAAEERQGVRVEAGDMLCLRTGWHRYFVEGDKARYSGPEAGPGLDSCRWFHEREIAGIAVDNWAFEAWPSTVPGGSIPVHQVAIRDIGLLVGEMFDYEDLVLDCEQDGVWDFMFSGVGLKVTGAVGSPLTPMALK